MCGGGFIGGFLVGQVASHDAAANRADHCVMTRVVARHRAHGSAFQAAFCLGCAGSGDQGNGA